MLGLRVGLVVNFGRPTVREGIDRVVNETREEYRQRLARECPAALRNVIREEDCPTCVKACATSHRTKMWSYC